MKSLIAKLAIPLEELKNTSNCLLHASKVILEWFIENGAVPPVTDDAKK